MIKHLWKYFVILFFLIFLIINWNEISVFFNYRVIKHNISAQDEVKVKTTDKQDSVEIAKLGIIAPIVTANSQFKENLENGVLLHPDSSIPDNIIILGHSAPDGWPDIKFDDIFSDLNYLENNDEITVNYSKKEYTYKVYEKRIFFPNEEDLLTEKPKILILITCWPPGKDYQRLAVFAELVDK